QQPPWAFTVRSRIAAFRRSVQVLLFRDDDECVTAMNARRAVHCRSTRITGGTTMASSRKQGSSKKVRYAVVGLGHIAQVAVLPAFANCKKSELAALVSSDPEKLSELSEKYGVEHCYSYDEYAQCLTSGEVDA